jgi:hypothetical protein
VQKRYFGRYNLKFGTETPAKKFGILYTGTKGDSDKRQRNDKLARTISDARLLKDTRHRSGTKHLRFASSELQ